MKRCCCQPKVAAILAFKRIISLNTSNFQSNHDIGRRISSENQCSPNWKIFLKVIERSFHWNFKFIDDKIKSDFSGNSVAYCNAQPLSIQWINILNLAGYSCLPRS